MTLASRLSIAAVRGPADHGHARRADRASRGSASIRSATTFLRISWVPTPSVTAGLNQKA